MLSLYLILIALGAVLLMVGRSYVGNDVTHSTLLDRACACSYKNLPKYRSYRVSNTAPLDIPQIRLSNHQILRTAGGMHNYLENYDVTVADHFHGFDVNRASYTSTTSAAKCTRRRQRQSQSTNVAFMIQTVSFE